MLLMFKYMCHEGKLAVCPLAKCLSYNYKIPMAVIKIIQMYSTGKLTTRKHVHLCAGYIE